jgi:hypothetical protein
MRLRGPAERAASDQKPILRKRPMCDECDDSSAPYLAYFNKPGGKRWRPPARVATAPLAVDRQAVESVPVTVMEVRRFSCD